MKFYGSKPSFKKHSSSKKALAFLAAGLMTTQMFLSAFSVFADIIPDEAASPECTCSSTCTDIAINESCEICNGDFSACTYKSEDSAKDGNDSIEGQAPSSDLENCVCTALCEEGKADENCAVCKDDFAKCGFKAPECVCTALCEDGKANENCAVCKDDFAKCAFIKVPECVCTALCEDGKANENCAVCKDDFAKCAFIKVPECVCTALCEDGKADENCAVCKDDFAKCAFIKAPECVCTALCEDGKANENCAICKNDFAKCAFKAPECVCTALCEDGKANENCAVCKDDFAKCAFKAPECVCTVLCEDGKANENCAVCKDDFTKCQFKTMMAFDSTPQALTSFITKVRLHKPNGEGEPSEEEITTSTPGTFPIDQEFCVKYWFEAGTTTIPTKMAPNTTYTLTLPNTLNFPSSGGTPVDINDEDSKLIGKFSISGKELTLITAVQSSETVDFSGEITGGYFWFKANLDKAQVHNLAPIKLSFDYNGGKNDIDIRVDGKQIEASVPLEKVGTPNLQTNEIEWTITAKPKITYAQSGEAHIDDLVIKDTIPSPPKHTYVPNSMTVTKNGAPDSAVTAEVVSDDVNFKFPTSLAVSSDTSSNPDNPNDRFADTYVIKYKTSFELDALTGAKFSNEVSADFNFPQYDLDKWKNTGTVETSANKPGTTAEVTATASVDGSFLDKSGALDSATARQINWAVTINKFGLKLQNAQITDTLDPGLKYIPSTIKLGETALTDNSSNPQYYVISGSGSVGDPQKLTVYLKGITSKNDLTYSTAVNETFWNVASNFPFKNNVTLTETLTPGTDIVLGTKTASVNPSASMMSKSGAYDPNDHTYTWTIAVNSNTNIPDQPFIITDILNENLVYVDSSFTSTISPVTKVYNPSDRTLTVSGSRLAAGTITFQTKLSDANKDTIWGNNYDVKTPYSNTATLKTGGATYSVSASPEVKSKVISKRSLGYTPSTKTVKWEIVVNENQMAVDSPVITDDIKLNPEKWAIDPAKVIVKQGSVNITTNCTINAKNGHLEIRLPNLVKAQDKVVITYETTLIDEELFQNNHKYALENEAKLVGSTIKNDGVTVSAKQDVANSMVRKEGKAKVADSSIDWTVYINESLLTLTDATITDPLDSALQFDAESFTLNRLGITDGKPDLTKATPVPIKPGQITFDSAANTFTFKIPGKITDAYRLTFNTAIDVSTTPRPVSISNSVSYGNSTSGISSSSAVNAEYAGGGGGASASKGSLTIIKKNKAGKPLEGAEFSVGNLTVKTDASGKAEIASIKKGTYDVIETKAPEGYTLAEKQSVTITAHNNTTVTFTDEKIKSDIKIKKVDKADNAVLSGAVFDVFKDDNTFVKSGTTGDDGTVTISDLEFGKYYFKEKTAPAGYLLNSFKTDFEIKIDNELIDVSSTPVQNEKITATIEVTKKDAETSAPLAGAKIALYNKSGDTLIAEKTSGADGKVVFNGIQLGTYYFKEVSAPADYTLNQTPSADIVLDLTTIGTQNGGNTLTFEMLNTRIPASSDSSSDSSSDTSSDSSSDTSNDGNGGGNRSNDGGNRSNGGGRAVPLKSSLIPPPDTTSTSSANFEQIKSAGQPVETRQSAGMSLTEISDLLDKGWIPLESIPDGLTREELVELIQTQKMTLGFYIPSTGDSSPGVFFPFVCAGISLLVIIGISLKKRRATN